jgi:Domain of unknown function (DUF4252)
MKLFNRIKSVFVILPLIFLGTGLCAQDDAIGRFFGKYVDDSRFTLVSVSPKMFRLIAKVNWDTVSPDIKQTIQKLQSLRILSTDVTPMEFYKEAMTKIDMKEYEELITMSGKNEHVRFVVKEDGGIVHELLMIAVDEDGFTLMSFVGDIDIDKLSKLASSMKIKGMENLKNVKRKK